MNRMKAFTVQQIKEECTGSYFSADYHFSKGDKNICLTINWFFLLRLIEPLKLYIAQLGLFLLFGVLPPPQPPPLIQIFKFHN